MGRRTNDQNRVLMHAWYASTTAQAKAMWTMAISQHQFYLDKKDEEVSAALILSFWLPNSRRAGSGSLRRPSTISNPHDIKLL